MVRRYGSRYGLTAAAVVLLTGMVWAVSLGAADGPPNGVRLVQVPYEAPPKSEPVPDVAVPPNTQPLSPEELQRAEALLPLLEGKQEFWAMGEFVHLGESVVPVVTKALTMSGPRIRYNAIETLSMLKSPAAAPALLETAKQPNELPRIREHALRTAIRLDPTSAPDAIEVMAKDPNAAIRKTAAFEARYVRHKAVVQPLIDLIGDDERFVAISALQSLWMLTRHESEFHDWEASSKQDRQAWAQEWTEWWNQAKDSFEIPEMKRRKTS
ncbi:MAG TPA: HEAT repeat domain-containing protein [Nitrospiraceae bacterium]|nr:HEAT repeat domain-containing protein [Nitrospiraceae bacterium]